MVYGFHIDGEMAKNGALYKPEDTSLYDLVFKPCAGSRVVRIDPLCFLAGGCRRLNQV